MTSWNYIAIRKKDGDHSYYDIHEGYYEDAEKVPSSWTTTPSIPSGETIKDLRKSLSDMYHDSFNGIYEIVNGELKVVEDD